MHSRLLPLAAATALAAAVPAQFTILMTSGTSDERTLGVDLPEIDTIRNDEIYEVMPVIGGGYTARPFLPTSLAWYYVGDQDNDGLYVDAQVDAPSGQIDEIFVKAGTVGPVGPRHVFFSIVAASANLPGVLPSDVVRYAGQGVREVFLTEAQLMVGTGGTSLNLDALCQSAAGDLFFSFSLTETLVIGSVDDGDLLMIPASAITYDAFGNVAAIAPGSVQLVATQAQLIAMINASGFRTSVGGLVTTTFELSGLEVDPNGGTFVAPANASLTLPNLLFCWNDSTNDGAIISTAGGGSFAVINGVPMASAIATQGDQLGWLPGSTGVFGPGGLALIPAQPPTLTIMNYPRNLHTAGSGQTLLQLQVSGGTPGGLTVLAWSGESSIPGGAFLSLPASPFVGELGLSAPVLVGVATNDALGNCSSQLFLLSTTALSGANVATQALDVTTFVLTTPGGISFL
jgi:hypothetical protein